MLVMKGGGTVLQSGPDAAARAAMIPAIAARPWAATGRMPVDDLVVWACETQRVSERSTEGLFDQEVAAAGLFRDRTSADGCAAVERIQAAGCRIDVSRGAGLGRSSEVADAVVALATPIADGLLVEWGRLGVAPDGWAVPARAAWPRYGWKVEGVDAAMIEFAGPGRSGAYVEVVIVSPSLIAEYRDRYRAWWDGLEELAWQLSARALGFAVTGPGAAREPWRDAARDAGGAAIIAKAMAAKQIA